MLLQDLDKNVSGSLLWVLTASSDYSGSTPARREQTNAFESIVAHPSSPPVLFVARFAAKTRPKRLLVRINASISIYRYIFWCARRLRWGVPPNVVYPVQFVLELGSGWSYQLTGQGRL